MYQLTENKNKQETNRKNIYINLISYILFILFR